MAGALATTVLVPGSARGQPEEGRPWLADRGPGIWTSIFGTYVRDGELLVSPFMEYYLDDNFEYKPAELGHGLDQDFRGRFRATEGLIFLAYGINDRYAVEFEAAAITASLEKAPEDPSTLPPRIEESGPGDWQAQIDWRVLAETAHRPEVFSYLEVEFPSNTNKLLIGTSDFTYTLAVGAIRGTRWGTFAGRTAVQYLQESGTADFGGFAVEYLKRVSPRWGLYGGIESVQDETELIGEAQLHMSDRLYFRFNLAYGLSSKATDWSPDVGVVFAFPSGK